MIKIALIGYGYWGPNVAKNIYGNSQYEFAGICDLRKEQLEKARKIYANEIRYVTDYHEFLADSSINAIAIAVQTEFHFQIAKEALLAGKHIYVEKPLVENCEQVKELQTIAQSKQLRIHVDHIMVYHPVVRYIKSMMDSGELGDVVYYDCSRVNLGNIKNDVSSMWDLSVHDLSIIDYLSNGQEIRSVSVLGKKMYSVKHSIAFMNLEYDTFIANIRSSWLSPIKERRIIIAGTKKMVVYDDMKSTDKLIVYNKGFDYMEGALADLDYPSYAITSRIGDAVIPYIPMEDALYNSLEEFRLSIVEKRESLTNTEAAIRVLQVLEKADVCLDGENI